MIEVNGAPEYDNDFNNIIIPIKAKHHSANREHAERKKMANIDTLIESNYGPRPDDPDDMPHDQCDDVNKYARYGLPRE